MVRDDGEAKRRRVGKGEEERKRGDVERSRRKKKKGRKSHPLPGAAFQDSSG